MWVEGKSEHSHNLIKLMSYLTNLFWPMGFGMREQVLLLELEDEDLVFPRASKAFYSITYGK